MTRPPDPHRPADDGEDQQGLHALLDEVEGEAAAQARRERAEEVRDRAAEAYRSVDLAGRLAAAVGRGVVLEVEGAGRVAGEVVAAGEGWTELRLDGSGLPAVVLGSALVTLRGLPEGTAAPGARPLGSRRGTGVVLWRLMADEPSVAVTTRDGAVLVGRAGRVGADFVELLVGGEAVLVALAGTAMVSVRRAGPR